MCVCAKCGSCVNLFRLFVNIFSSTNKTMPNQARIRPNCELNAYSTVEYYAKLILCVCIYVYV